MKSHEQAVEKHATGIPGFDLISEGGLPRQRATLIAGTAGSAKTVFATQFLAAGIEQANETGVFVTFEDGAADIRRNMLGFGWDIARWEKEGKWAFVDASPVPDEPHEVECPTGLSDVRGGIGERGNAQKRAIANRQVAVKILNKCNKIRSF